jgi:HEPN domain-containing protein
MQSDKARLGAAQQWLARADHDLTAAGRLLDAPALPAEAPFHARQAAEKALEGLLAWDDRTVSRTHDLGELVHDCTYPAPELAGLRDDIDGLTRFAVAERYPSPGPEPTGAEVTAALVLARTVYRIVMSHFPHEADL